MDFPRRAANRIEAASSGVPGGTLAPGYRSYTSGAPVYVGNLGFSWSAATSGIYGLDLGFSSQNLNASNGDYRGNGFPLRCLSE